MTKNTHHNATTRFSSTVENYVKYRPDYPATIIDLLKTAHLTPSSGTIADIGSGTGIFAKLLLNSGYHVLGIEPNTEMRQKAEQLLSSYPYFTSKDGSAEKTGLPDNSVDAITAATAFHWFDSEKAKKEFNRILKPKGFVLLVWNLRQSDASSFMQGYEALLNTYGTDYKDVAAEKKNKEEILAFFHPAEAQLTLLPNHQIFDWEGFQGRLLSTSYTPKPGHPRYEEMMNAAKLLFDKHQDNSGKIQFIYNTACYYAHWLI